MGDLLLPQGVVFKGLYSLFRVHLGRENIVQTKLSWKNIHQDVHGMFRIRRVRISIENIYRINELKHELMDSMPIRM